MSWDYVPLDKLGAISRGVSKHRPRNDKTLFGGEYPFIQTADVKAAELYLTEYSETYNDKGLAQSKLWSAGTLCITIAANIADTAILGIDACFPDSIMGFTPYEGVSNVKFVKYAFDILQKDCQKISQGTAQDNLSWKKLSTIKFPAPSIEVQDRIVSVLSTYDNLIDNNRRQIVLLEEAAQRLYKEWFVDLRFPGYENTKIVDGVPEGWEEKQLSDFADVVMGQSPKSEFYNKEKRGLPFHQGVGSYGDRFVKDETYSTAYTRVVEAGSILFSVRAPVGRLNLTKHRVVIGRGLSAINHKDGLQSFLYYLLKGRFFKDNIIGNGSIFASINKEELLSQAFLIPTHDVVRKFDHISSAIDRRIDALDVQTKMLMEARDRLLPKLMSGEIAV
jgi:type I restriction-modification system specificity subunit